MNQRLIGQRARAALISGPLAMPRVFSRSLACAALAALISSCGGGGGGSTPPSPITVTFSTAPPSSLQVSTAATFVAAVEGDRQDLGVTWTATCSAANCGSFNNFYTLSGSPTVYTAPDTVPSPTTVTVTASSFSDPNQHTSGTVTITPAPAPMADGTYIFHLSGNDGAGPYAVAGAFTVATGKITGGEQDFSAQNRGYRSSFVPANSSMKGAGGNIEVVLDTGNARIGNRGVETLRGTMVSAEHARIAEFDPNAAGTGSLDLQTGAATPAAGYAFAVSGTDVNGNSLAIGGVLEFDAGTLKSAGSVFDISAFTIGSNTAAVTLKQSFQSGSVTAPDAFGRLTLTLTPSATSGVPAFAFAGYLAGANQIQLVASRETSDLLQANTAGVALGQGANTGRFSGTSEHVFNQSYAHGSSGVDANGAAVMSGAFRLQGNGVLGGVIAVDDLAHVGAWNLGGTYTVDATGRVTVSATRLTSETNATPPARALAFELYLDGNGNAMVMGADGFQTTQGIASEQAESPFELSGAVP